VDTPTNRVRPPPPRVSISGSPGCSDAGSAAGTHGRRRSVSSFGIGMLMVVCAPLLADAEPRSLWLWIAAIGILAIGVLAIVRLALKRLCSPKDKHPDCRHEFEWCDQVADTDVYRCRKCGMLKGGV